MPSRIIPLTLTLVVAVVSLLNAAKPSGQEQVYKEVDGRKLKLYVTKPDGWQKTDSRPAVVFFHGGGWVGGAPGQFTEHSKYLAERGMVAIQVGVGCPTRCDSLGYK